MNSPLYSDSTYLLPNQLDSRSASKLFPPFSSETPLSLSKLKYVNSVSSFSLVSSTVAASYVCNKDTLPIKALSSTTSGR